MATFTIEPAGQDTHTIGQKIYFRIDDGLTLRGLKDHIIHNYDFKRQTKITIHGPLEKVPDDALVLKHISGTKILFVASNDEQEHEEEAPKGPKPEDKFRLDKNEADETAKQSNLIQGQAKSERSVDAIVSENKATAGATQRNIISFEMMAISFDF